LLIDVYWQWVNIGRLHLGHAWLVVGQAGPDPSTKSYGCLGMVAISGKAATLAALDMILKQTLTMHFLVKIFLDRLSSSQ
jgi:hypothetical protein